MAKRDYYEVLGVVKTCTQDEIKKAFREIAKKHHPDLNPNNKESEEILKVAAEAYSVLSDPEKRKMYDRFGSDMPGGVRSGFDPGADIFSSMGDLFEEIFGGFGGGGARGGGRARGQRGRDLAMEMELTLEESAKGGSSYSTIRTDSSSTGATAPALRRPAATRGTCSTCCLRLATMGIDLL